MGGGGGGGGGGLKKFLWVASKKMAFVLVFSTQISLVFVVVVAVRFSGKNKVRFLFLVLRALRVVVHTS